MTEGSNLKEFSGSLGRATVTSAFAELRFYSFDFSTETSAKPVFAVCFDEPRFTADDVNKLMNEDAEITVFHDRVEVLGLELEDSVVLHARSVTASWASYDTGDFVQRVRQLDEAYARTRDELTPALMRNHKIHLLIIELLRRAELKAASSTELGMRQAAAISVLKRVLRQIEGGE